MLTQAVNGAHRKLVGTDAALEEAERLGYIVAVDGGYVAGDSRPAA